MSTQSIDIDRDQRKLLPKKKAEDPKGYKEKVNEWKKKQEAKQKSKDPDTSRENVNKRNRIHIAKKQECKTFHRGAFCHYL